MIFQRNTYYGYLIQGKLRDAIQYLQQFPEQEALYNKYISLFEHEQYIKYDTEDKLNEILTIYQQYYRDVFYLNLNAEEALARLQKKVSIYFDVSTENMEFSDLENSFISHAFTVRGYHFLGGRTGGYYGPYIWKDTQLQTFHVELPDGTQEYSVQFLSGFLTKSWIDYLSFGQIGTGGWTNGDGIINCIKDAYDLESENFRVSLLKHEAQHAMDLAAYPSMASEDLEYRAKLVELIYSEQRNLLTQFIPEADNSQKSNGHACASDRIIAAFEQKLGKNRSEFGSLTMEVIHATAKELFLLSNEEMKIKYEALT